MPRIIQYLARGLQHAITVIGIFKNHVTQVVIDIDPQRGQTGSHRIPGSRRSWKVFVNKALYPSPLVLFGVSDTVLFQRIVVLYFTSPHAEDFGHRKSLHNKGSPQENDILTDSRGVFDDKVWSEGWKPEHEVRNSEK